MKARIGWEETFRRMAERGHDAATGDEPVSLTEFDDEEWEWSPLTSTSHATTGEPPK